MSQITKLRSGSLRVVTPDRTTLCRIAQRRHAPTSATLLRRFWNADPAVPKILPAWRKGETPYTVYGPLTFACSIHHYRIMLRRSKTSASPA